MYILLYILAEGAGGDDEEETETPKSKKKKGFFGMKYVPFIYNNVYYP